MKQKTILISMFCLSLTILNVGCIKKEGCMDRNADNYDPDAKKSATCIYRYAASIDISNVPTTNASGGQWDADGSAADLKVNFGKNSNSGYEFTTNTSDNSLSASLAPASNVQFTNEEWKYQLVDDDLITNNEVIASGTFNPLAQGGSNVISLNNGGITLKFKYTTR